MATYYWVGGAGTWNTSTTTNWAASSGGAGGAGVPTAADDVIFDNNSNVGTGTFSVTISAAVCNNFSCGSGASALDGAMTLSTGSSTLTVSGSMTTPATNFIYAGTGTITFNATTTGKTYTNNAVATNSVNFNFNGVGGGWTIVNTFTGSTASSLTLTAGTLDLGNNTITVGTYNGGGAGTRTLAFGTGNITVIGSGGFNCSATTLGGLTITGTPVINLTYSGAAGTRSIRWGSTSGGSASTAVTFNISAGTDIISFNGHAINLIFTGFAGTCNPTATVYGNLTYSSGMTNTGASTVTLAGASGTQLITSNAANVDQPITQNNPGATLQLQDNLTMGSTRTFTLTAGDLHINNRTLSTGLFNSNTTNTRTIDFKSGNITVTGNNAVVWNTTTATNLSVLGTPVVNCTYAGSTGTRVLAVNRTTLNGIESKAINFYINAGTDSIITGAANDSFKTLSFTGFSGSFTFNATTVYQDLILSSGMTLNSSATGVNFSGNTTQLVTTAGKTLDFPITFGSASSTPTVIFQDALTQGSTRAFTITNGTVQLKASATSTTGVFGTTGTTQKYLQSTTPGTQATLTQASGTVDATYLSIKDINATGGATWNALWSNNNVDEGNNSGWVFGDPPIISAVEYTYALKSFTQPRRF